MLESDDPDHKDLFKAHRFKVKRLTNTPQAEFRRAITVSSATCAEAS